MGAAASVNVVQEETQRPLDASDVDTPRGVSAKAEVTRLRGLLASHSTSFLPVAAAATAQENQLVDASFQAMPPGIQEYLINAFRGADTDASDVLSYEEFTRMVRSQLPLNLTENEIEQLEAHCAYNPGSQVTWNDFVMIAPQLLKNVVIESEPSYRDWCVLTNVQGIVYYYNKRTLESCWERPAELLERDQQLLATAASSSSS